MTEEPSVTIRVYGGLGNQLFMYAMGRRVSLLNSVPLYIDSASGFAGDFYRRNFELTKFNIAGKQLSQPSRLRASRIRKRISMAANLALRFGSRRTYYEKSLDFDPRYLGLVVKRPIYIDGYWQDERYFEDIRAQLKEDLAFREPHPDVNERIAAEMRAGEAVAVHIRQLHGQPAGVQQTRSNVRNLPEAYYLSGIAKIKERAPGAKFYVFSDKNDVSFSFFRSENVTRIVNEGPNSAYEDLWLMSRCRHFLLANSTFSWWGAWLGFVSDSIVVSPSAKWANTARLPAAWNAIEWSA